MRILAYGDAADLFVEYIRYSESMILRCLIEFLDAFIRLYGEQYLRFPNLEDAIRISTDNARRGFPGLLGNLDCMHMPWEQCPKAWQGQYKSGRKDGPIIVLEAIATQDLWIWHSFCGVPGSLLCNFLFHLAQFPLQSIYSHHLFTRYRE